MKHCAPFGGFLFIKVGALCVVQLHRLPTLEFSTGFVSLQSSSLNISLLIIGWTGLGSQLFK